MNQNADIFNTLNLDFKPNAIDVIFSKEQNIPGSINYSITRFHTSSFPKQEDGGMMLYNIQNSERKDENFLELRYCINAAGYCSEKNCRQCSALSLGNCFEQMQLTDVFVFRFTHTFLSQFTINLKLTDRKDEVLAFRYPVSFSKIFPLCSRKRNILETLFTHNYNGSLENIFVNAKIQELLLYSLECLISGKEDGFVCKFLANEQDRAKIMQARDILLQHIGNPITIRELSRKAAINECYLKKGFKEIFGTTIFDFYQQQRMEHAKYLLYEKGLSVTDVSISLGYSSISHFSTAFKRHTGLKPCELLYAGA